MFQAENLPARIGESRYFHDATAAEVKAVVVGRDGQYEVRSAVEGGGPGVHVRRMSDALRASVRLDAGLTAGIMEGRRRMSLKARWRRSLSGRRTSRRRPRLRWTELPRRLWRPRRSGMRRPSATTGFTMRLSRGSTIW